ncbi:MAG TPA: hypothetical protein VK338_06375 [Candidatus Nitrosocosmicus sp.]|nr:hypothetical protein [Candidatus Nitrosocosmicus sp.]
MAKIKKIRAREILDSRGIPTIEGQLILDNDQEIYASASSGESLGKYEGCELRDADNSRYFGMGVKKAVSYINDLLAPKLVGTDPMRQADIDFWLLKADGTPDRSRLGVNSMMVVSQLVFKAAAYQSGLKLYKYINDYFNKTYKKNIQLEKIPSPIFSMINGGKHGTKNLEFQEFQFIPSTALRFNEALEMGVSMYSMLKTVLDYRNAGISVSEEGGFTPNLLTNSDALEVMKETLLQKKIKLGVDAFFGLDIAAAQFIKGDKYRIKDKPNPLSVTDYIAYIAELIKQYNILVVEDPIGEEDFANWHVLSEMVGENTYIVGDDFIAGSKDRLKRASDQKSCSSVLIKYNQVATISEIFEFVNVAKDANVKTIFSQRLGETNDSIIADFAVGIQSYFVKFGAPVRGERVAKYNRLLQINDELNEKS